MVTSLIFLWPVTVFYLMIFFMLSREKRPKVLFWKTGLITALIRLSVLCFLFILELTHRSWGAAFPLAFLLYPEGLLMSGEISLSYQIFIIYFILLMLGSFLWAAVFSVIKFVFGKMNSTKIG